MFGIISFLLCTVCNMDPIVITARDIPPREPDVVSIRANLMDYYENVDGKLVWKGDLENNGY